MPTQATLAALTPFDWLLVTIVGFSTLMAFRRGIIKVLFSLVGVTVGILLASWNYHTVAETLHRWVSSAAAAEILAFLLILIAAATVFTLAAGFARKTASAIGLGFVDRLLGAVFGLVRGLLLGTTLLMALAAFSPSSPWLRESRLAPGFLAGAHAVSFFVPERLQQRIASGAAQLVQQSPGAFKSQTSAHSM